MHDVFISHSTKNAAIADAVCHRLESDNVRCWYAPRDVQAGTGWAGQLMRAIREAKVFLLIYSEEYNRSQQVISELTEAVDAGCTIVPFRIDQCDMNDDLAYYLKKVHWLDAVNPPTQNNIEVLHHHISRILGMEPPEPPQPSWWEKLRIFFRPAWRKWLLAVSVLVVCLVCILSAFGGKAARELEEKRLSEEFAQIDQKISEDIAQARSEIELIGPETAEYQNIDFVNLSRLDKYRYPYASGNMASANLEFICLENKETGKIVLGRTDNGSVYLSDLELEIENPRYAQFAMTDGYNTVYFIDHATQKITSYDRANKQWINQTGTYYPLGDTECIYTTGFFEKNMMSENLHMEELMFLIYDVAPEVNCLSKAIYISPDGTVMGQDISHYGIVQIVAGIDKPGCDGFLVSDKAGNLRVFDSTTAQVLDLTHGEILQDYLPFVHDSTVLCEDSRYFLTYQNSSAEIWDLQTGSRAYSRTFADYASVYFSAPHEIVVYNDENNSVFTCDLETGKETAVMDRAYFESNDVFLKNIMKFAYSAKYDVCVFATSGGYDGDTLEGTWRIVVTDLQGNILAASDELTSYNGSHTCQLYFVDNMLFADITLADWDTAEPEDGIITELFRAVFSVDEEGNLTF